MFVGDFPDTCQEKFPFMSMGMYTDTGSGNCNNPKLKTIKLITIRAVQGNLGS
jgi:hypothetical protein